MTKLSPVVIALAIMTSTAVAQPGATPPSEPPPAPPPSDPAPPPSPDASIGAPPSTGNVDLDALIAKVHANAIRALSMDAVQKANSGHPGMPMGMADIAEVLWSDHLKHNPGNPQWADRDRFVLSAGHGSALLYSLLHLTGYDLSLDQLKQFRQLGSQTPGHPEHGDTAGVETTTGPLGQGYATSVGMAIASKWMATRYNKPGFDMFTGRIYALGGDGCMMEGLSHEAASLAGHLKLDNLCWIYDDNKITIEGHTHLAFSEDVATRFLAYGWNVLRVGDANDTERIEQPVRTPSAGRT